MKNKLRYTDRYKFVIGVLYELKMNGKSGYYSLKQILNKIGFEADYDEIFQIGKYLETQGYIEAIFVIGDVQMKISPNGIIYWEEEMDKFPVKLEEFVKSKEIQDLVKDTVDSFQQKDFIKTTRKELFEIVDKIINKTKKISNEYPDLFIDAQILQLELNKVHPDKEILLNKLDAISQISGLMSEIIYIKNILNIV